MTRFASTAALTATLLALAIAIALGAAGRAGYAVNGVSISGWTLFVDCSRLELSPFSDSLIAIPIWQIAAMIVVTATLSYGVICLCGMLHRRVRGEE
jgi:hypothetical protein